MIVREVFATRTAERKCDYSHTWFDLFERSHSYITHSRQNSKSFSELIGTRRTINSLIGNNDSLFAEYPLVVLFGHPSQLCGEGWQRGSGSDDDDDDNRGYGWWMPRVAERETESRTAGGAYPIYRENYARYNRLRWHATARARLLLLRHTDITNSGKITHRTKEDRDVALRALPFARVWILRGVCETARQGGRPLPPQRSTEIAERGRASPNIAARPVSRITSRTAAIFQIHIVINIWGVIIIII